MKKALNNILCMHEKKHVHTLTHVFILLFFCIINIPVSDEICDLLFDGCPEDFSGDTIVVPDEIVALSKGVYACEAEKVIEGIADGTGPSSIVFIIDHSYSMMGLGNAYPGNDQYGARFRVVRDLLDSIYSANPNTEIGLVVFREVLFFDHTNNDLFLPLPGHDNQSYLPLKKLNSKISGGKQGIEAIKDLLETDTINNYNRQYRRDVECVDLKYKPQFQTIGNTNINTAFDAAKAALASSSYPKTNRFIIFLSDGEPYPPRAQNRDPFEFVNGENTPTTFTIFFNNRNTAPQSIRTMTENISQNGYSESNKSSSIWTIQAEYQNLMQLLKVNIFSNLIQIVKSYPSKISINGKTSTEYTNSIFLFQDRFLFNKSTTEFTFDITYKVENKETDKVEEKSTNSKFYFRRSPHAAMPKGFKKECWDRSMGFYFNNRKINAADETMDDLEIRFQFDPGEADYYYTNVDVDIMSNGNGTNDKETFTLDKKGSGFTTSFKRIIETKSSENGTLEHLEVDSIIAVYRNPDIVLDSLRIAIPFGISSIVTVKKGTYFDTNGDGYADSIFITTEGELLPKNLPDFITSLQLPSHRGFSIRNSFAAHDGISLLVDENKSSKPRTNVTKDDILIVNQKMLSHGGLLLKHSSQFIDKMAPVITGANLLDYTSGLTKDTLYIVFSEHIKDIRNNNPFYFRNPVTGIQYIATLKQISLQKNVAHFRIDKIIGINSEPVEDMNPGDSVWIKTDRKNNILDAMGNDQNNPDNVRAILTIQPKYLPFSFILSSTTPYDVKKMNSIPSFILSLPEISSFITKKSFVKKDGSFQGMIIMVKPDNPKQISKDETFSATLSIFDNVSNPVLQDEPMGFYHGNGNLDTRALFFAWDGSNLNNRYVSSGVYVAIARINHLNNVGEIISTTTKKAFVGLKK